MRGRDEGEDACQGTRERERKETPENTGTDPLGEKPAGLPNMRGGEETNSLRSDHPVWGGGGTKKKNNMAVGGGIDETPIRKSAGDLSSFGFSKPLESMVYYVSGSREDIKGAEHWPGHIPTC